jgi:hypothetical protein
VTSIVLVALQYRYTNPDFVDTIWKHFSVLITSSTIYGTLVSMLGITAFNSPNYRIIITVFYFNQVCCSFIPLNWIWTSCWYNRNDSRNKCLNFNIAGYADFYLGCNAKIYGILEVWKGMDSYILEVDKLLCSSLCPCNLKNIDLYNNPQSNSNISKWAISNEAYNAINFQGCDNEIKAMALKEAASNTQVFGNITDFNQNNFFKFFARIEEEFECSGWCQRSYQINGQEEIISKYLFTDINR